MFPKGVPVSKRFLDLFLALLGLILLSPILALVALLVLIVHGPPILFRQMRPGYRGKPFLIYKFRTMTDAQDKYGLLLPDEERLTILRMLQEKKISLQDAEKLLAALEGK